MCCTSREDEGAEKIKPGVPQGFDSMVNKVTIEVFLLLSIEREPEDL